MMSAGHSRVAVTAILMAQSQSSWIEFFNPFFLPRPHSRSGDLKHGMPASAILLHDDIGEAVEGTGFQCLQPQYSAVT